MTEITIIRHGETDSNVRGTYLGWTDIELNEKGLNQAKLAKTKLESESFDVVYASPLRRTLKTAQIVNTENKYVIQLEDRLKERNFGVWDNLTHEEIVKNYPEEHKSWSNDWIHFRVEGGESSIDAYSRLTEFLDEMIKEHKGKKILLVTHLGCARKIFSYLLGMGLEGSWHFKIDNATINKINVNDEGYAYLTALNQ